MHMLVLKNCWFDFKHFSYSIKTEVKDLCVVKPDGKHPLKLGLQKEKQM